MITALAYFLDNLFQGFFFKVQKLWKTPNIIFQCAIFKWSFVQLTIFYSVSRFRVYHCVWNASLFHLLFNCDTKITEVSFICEILLFYFLRDTFVLCLVNGGSSFVAGFAIFSVLGFMSYEQGLPISEVAASGKNPI